MRRIKILLPCALSILALCAVAPADSSALLAFPEIGRCVKVAPGTGAYALATCTGGAKGGGEFEWQPGLVKPKFLGKGGITRLGLIRGATRGDGQGTHQGDAPNRYQSDHRCCGFVRHRE